MILTPFRISHRTHNAKWFAAVLSTLMISSAIASVSASAATTAAPPKFPATITLAESPSTAPLSKAWFSSYRSIAPTSTVVASPISTAKAIASVYAGTALTALTDNFVSASEVPDLRIRVVVPVAVEAVGVAYNLPKMAKPLRLNGQLLAAIYSGKITKWNSPKIAAANPGLKLPKLTIVTVHRSDASISTLLFTQYLATTVKATWPKSIGIGAAVQWPKIDKARGEQSENNAISDCLRLAGCISYLTSEDLGVATKEGLGIAALANPHSNYVLPNLTSESIVAATAKTPANGNISLVNSSVKTGYPIVGYLYLLVMHDQPDANTAATLRSFFSWTFSTTGGQSSSLLSGVGLAALPKAVATRSLALISKID